MNIRISFSIDWLARRLSVVYGRNFTRQCSAELYVEVVHNLESSMTAGTPVTVNTAIDMALLTLGYMQMERSRGSVSIPAPAGPL